jgi:serine/threonine protein kinase
MVMQLSVIAGPDKGLTIPLTDEGSLRIGRDKSIDKRLSDPHVSRKHCNLQIDEEGHALLIDGDENGPSKGGTFVNGLRITRQRLKAGDLIQIGGTHLRFDNTEGGEATTLTAGVAPPVEPAANVPLDRMVGQTLAHFEIQSVVAKGRSSVVFKAHDAEENRTVALKVLQPEFSQDDEEVQRFIRAMKTMLPLRHPNLVELYAAGRAGPHCWVAMEYVDGESLTQVIQRLGVAGMLDWRHALRTAIHIARALDYAYQEQIIHRNISPPNILVRSSDKVAKLGDLMLAKALEGSLAQQITRPGEILGEINYMSPERTRGTTDIDGRSDIYSLGATVYALLTGRPPFTGGSLPETIAKIRSAEPEKPKKFQLAIPDLFEGTVLKMLAKRPEERFQTAGEMLSQLERVARFSGLTF